jgi:hypothetical protein
MDTGTRARPTSSPHVAQAVTGRSRPSRGAALNVPAAEGPGGRGERQLAAATAAEEPHADPLQGWGPYQESIDELVTSCADYLGRRQRSLSGEISAEPMYFHGKAALL